MDLKRAAWRCFDRLAQTDLGRRLVWRAAEAVGIEQIVINSRHGRFAALTGDKMIGFNILRLGSFCWHISRKTAQHAAAYNGLPDGAGRAYIDIGANIGTNTIYALRDFGFGTAICFEPESTNYEQLTRNIGLNGYSDRCATHRVGLGDSSAWKQLALSRFNFGDHHVVDGDAEDSVGEKVLIERFDDLVSESQLANTGLVSIDVQGYEGHVLAGAASLLAADIPLACEITPHQLERVSGAERFHRLVEASYDWFELLTEEGRVYPIAHLRAVADAVRPGGYHEAMFYKRKPPAFPPFDMRPIMTGA